MILSVGEILADMIGSRRGKTVQYECFAGGAPFNVACGVARLGGEVAFCGCVGKDEIGQFLKAYAENEKGLGGDVAVSEDRNTTLAFVTLSESGERSFSFYRKNTADYEFDFSRVEPFVKRADIVHVGSLMLSEAEGRAFAEKLIAAVKKAGKKVSFDVNFRDDIFPDRESAVAVYGKFIDGADILKLSEDEVGLFFGGEDFETAVRRLGKRKKVFVTLGKRGSLFCEGDTFVKEGTIDVKVVDTTGAGDAFYAGALKLVDEGERDAGKILRYANVCGSLTTARKGALEAIPCEEEVKKYL